MLTADDIIRSLRLRQQYGLRGGACFGTSDVSRLRGGGHAFQPLERGNAKLTFCEGHGLRSEPDPCFFNVETAEQAVRHVKTALKIKGELTVRKFQAAGGRALFFESTQIFPPVRKTRRNK